MAQEVAPEHHVTFGFEEFWPSAHSQHKQQFEAIASLMSIANEMVLVAESKASEPVEKVICALTRVTMSGMTEVIVLCGNGCGMGAMKIARGMFESSTTAEYLRQNPKEAEDYLDFGAILSWRRYQWLLANSPEDAARVSSETAKSSEDLYNQVKGRFTDSRDRERNQWSTKSIRKMAEELARRDQYDLIYGLASSIHHTNFEGLVAGFRLQDAEIVPDLPPSMNWVREALIAAHANLLFALSTLNDSCTLGFSDNVKTAEQGFEKGWKR